MTTTTNTPRSARSLSAILIIAFLILSVVILLVSGGLQLFFYIQTQQQAVSSQQELLAQGAAATVSNFIQQKFTALSITTIQLASPTVTSSEAQTEILKGLLGSQSEFLQFAFFDNYGHETASVTRIQFGSSVASAQLANLVTSDILALTKKKQNYISSVYFDPATTEPTVFMAVPMVNALGNYQGTLVAELNLISMWNSVNQLKVGNTGYAYVVNSQGTLIAFKDTDRALKGENVGDIKLVHEFILNPASVPAKGINIYTGINGARVVGAYASLGTPNWAVVVELPWQEAYQPVFQVIAVSTGIILLMAVLAGLAGIWIARRLAVPLVDLTKTATRIAGGEMQLQATPGGAQEIASLAMAFNSMTSQLRELISSLEQRVAERTIDLERSNQTNQQRAQELQIVAEVAQAIASLQDPDNLLSQITQIISQRFGYYHTGVFMLDDQGEYAVLRAANSEGGQRMLAREHKLRLGATSIVGYVASSAKPRVSSDVGVDAVYFNNPDLPATHAEMALPLMVGDQLIGVLDIQSTEASAFGEEQIEVLTTLANQVAVAIENARLFSQTSHALTEAQKIYDEFVAQGWEQYSKAQTIIGYRSHKGKTSSLAAPLDIKASAANADSIEGELAFPIRIRNQTIGVLNIRPTDRARRWSENELAVARAAVERAALALENARLLDDAQRRSARERTIGEISTKISAASDIDSIMRLAVEELGKKLGSSTEVTLELGSDSQESNHD